MQSKKERTHAYYGELGRAVVGESLPTYAVDQAFLRLLEKYEDKLIDMQSKLIKDLRETFYNDVIKFNKELMAIRLRLSEIEKKLSDKEEEDK